MIKSKHYGPIIITFILLILGIPMLLITNSHKTIKISSTTSILLGILIVCGLLILFYGEPKFKSISRKRNFKLAYKPDSDLDRLKEYIQNRINSKESYSKIKNTLLKVGWDEDIINQAFNSLDKLKPITPKRFIKSIKKNAKVK